MKRLILDLLKKIKTPSPIPEIEPEAEKESSADEAVEASSDNDNEDLKAATLEASLDENSTEMSDESSNEVSSETANSTQQFEFIPVPSPVLNAETAGEAVQEFAALAAEATGSVEPEAEDEPLPLPADFIENAMPESAPFNPLEPVHPRQPGGASAFFQTDPGITLRELRAIFDGPDWSKLMRNARDGGATSILACRVLDKTMALLQHGNKHVERMLDAAQNVRATTGQLASIAEDIKQVSNQTRIVSINAGIEANRAGVHGRTFQVVAQQMTTLSEDARHLTLSIDSKLHGVNEKININRELCGEVGKLFGDMNTELGEFRRMMIRVEELAEIQVEQLGHIEHIIIEPAIKKDAA